MFKSKKKTSVGTSASPLIDRDEEVPNFHIQSILRYIMGGNGLSNELLQGVIDSPFFAVRKAMRYAKDGYIHGLPRFSYVSSSTGKENVKQIIEAQIGREIKIHYYQLNDWNLVHRTWDRLVQDWGFNSNTNEITRMSQDVGKPCYLKDFKLVYSVQTVEESDGTLLRHWGVLPQYGYAPSRPLNKTGRASNFVGTPTPFDVIDGKTEDSTFDGDDDFDEDDPIVDPYENMDIIDEVTEVTYEWDDNGTIKTGTFLIDHGQASAWDEGVVQVLYEYTMNELVYYGWWTYELGTGRPVLDQIIRDGSGRNSEIFPIVPFRRNRQNVISRIGRNSKEFKSIDKLLSIVGLDYEELSKEIHKNGDIQYVEQAVLMFGVPLNARTQPELGYLWHFFNRIYIDRSQLVDGRTGSLSVNLKQHDFSAKFQFRSLTRTTTAGKFGKVGQFRRQNFSEPYEVHMRRQVCTGGDGGGDCEMVEYTVIRYRDGVRYQHQVTSNMIVSYEMVEPTQVYDIWEGHKTTAKRGDDHFLIPLDHALADDIGFTILDRNELYLRSIHFVFNARRTQKVKWYQRGFFKVVLVVAAIAITIYSGFQAWQTITAALALGAAAVAFTVISMVVKAIVIRYAFNFLAEQIGADWAFFLAVAAATVGGYKAFQHGSLNGAPYASELLMVSNGLAQGSQHAIKQQMKDLRKDALDFQKEMETKLDALEEAESLLERTGAMDPFEFLELIIGTLPNESPDFFYQRTVHSGNIGALVLDAPSNFVDTMLMLPYQGNPAQL